MKYFSIEELTRSATATARGIDNTPTAEHLHNLTQLTEQVLDPLREAWAQYCEEWGLGSGAIKITSGYRGFRLNDAIGGANRSAHCVGYAADLVPSNGKMLPFKKFVKRWAMSVRLDQVISEKENEYGAPRWIHIGMYNQDGAQRGQFLSFVGSRYIPMT